MSDDNYRKFFDFIHPLYRANRYKYTSSLTIDQIMDLDRNVLMILKKIHTMKNPKIEEFIVPMVNHSVVLFYPYKYKDIFHYTGTDIERFYCTTPIAKYYIYILRLKLCPEKILKVKKLDFGRGLTVPLIWPLYD